MSAVIIGTLIAEREIRRRGEDSEFIWDAVIWVLPAAIIGARLWYVINDILGGGTRFLENPVQILLINEGGLHIYGAILFGMASAIIFARRNGIDIWIILDSIAPVLLIGQALARPANFINQELYGPPTNLPWGIYISPDHRIPPYNDLTEFPSETTRFHPTFAYEMIWNLAAAALLIWIARRFKDTIKPGTIFAGWLILAGLGRFFIESFRPDQPRIPGTPISITRVIAALMVLFGTLWLLARYKVINFPLMDIGPEKYRTRKPA